MAGDGGTADRSLVSGSRNNDDTTPCGEIKRVF
jgi:hypothetical protein